MRQKIAGNETRNPRWSWVWKIGGVSALLAGILLLIGIIDLIVSVLQSRSIYGWFSLLGNNWLVKIFFLHAEISDIQTDTYGLNLLDIVFLLLVCLICFSISFLFRKARKIWSLIALALSVIAIILFLVTQNAGRSTVMLAVLIISIVMLKDKRFNKVTIFTGILAGVFLFVGDLTVGIHSNIITILFSIGYVLLLLWFFLIAQILLHPEHTV